MPLVALGFVSSCAQDVAPIFRCDVVRTCDAASRRGYCEPTGYCSFDDEICPSGRRYGELAGNGLADACVTTTCGELSGKACADDEICLRAEVGPSDAPCCPNADCLATRGKELAEAAWAAVEPVIDAVRSDWTGVEWHALGKRTAGSPPTERDFSARFALQWHMSGLYVLVEVTDDKLVPPNSGSNHWDDDAVELFIDLDVRHGSEMWADNERQFFVLLDGKALEWEAHPLGWPIKAASDSASGGWWAEVKISWPAGFRAPEPGDVIGFDVAADDDDSETPGWASNQLAWNAESGVAKNSLMFGLVRLRGDPPAAR